MWNRFLTNLTCYGNPSAAFGILLIVVIARNCVTLRKISLQCKSIRRVLKKEPFSAIA